MSVIHASPNSGPAWTKWTLVLVQDGPTWTLSYVNSKHM
jgi:hypothetical protein